MPWTAQAVIGIHLAAFAYWALCFSKDMLKPPAVPLFHCIASEASSLYWCPATDLEEQDSRRHRQDAVIHRCDLPHRKNLRRNALLHLDASQKGPGVCCRPIVSNDRDKVLVSMSTSIPPSYASYSTRYTHSVYLHVYPDRYRCAVRCCTLSTGASMHLCAYSKLPSSRAR